jgi:uncharacterized protein (DUF1015 family)
MEDVTHFIYNIIDKHHISKGQHLRIKRTIIAKGQHLKKSRGELTN